MTRRTICAFALVVVLIGSANVIAQGASQPSLVIRDNQVIASSFPPGSTIVLYSVSLVGDGYSTSTKARSARLTDDDHDGSVTFDYPGPMPFRSVWIAVNEANGDYATTSPSGYSHKAGLPPALRRHGSLVDEIDWSGRATYLLYVHPGKGSWTAFTIDGRDDADGKVDYVTSIPLSRLRPVQPDNPDKPVELKPGGTLFIVDAENLRSSVVRLDGAILNGAN